MLLQMSEKYAGLFALVYAFAASGARFSCDVDVQVS